MAWPPPRLHSFDSSPGILLEIYHQRGDEEAAEEHGLQAVAFVGSEVAVRGSASTAAAKLHLAQGELQNAEQTFRKARSDSTALSAGWNASLTAPSRLRFQNRRAKEATAFSD